MRGHGTERERERDEEGCKKGAVPGRSLREQEVMPHRHEALYDETHSTLQHIGGDQAWSIWERRLDWIGLGLYLHFHVLFFCYLYHVYKKLG
jgi:hypothetical protein